MRAAQIFVGLLGKLRAGCQPAAGCQPGCGSAALCHGVLNGFGGGVPRYAASPGLTPSFRRSLPETGCLSQGLPYGKRFAWPCPPKAVKHPVPRESWFRICRPDKLVISEATTGDTMSTSTNLNEAFAGESQASQKYRAFARKAEQDGMPNVARLFRTAAEAEVVHAQGHFKAMDGAASTLDNLKSA